MAFIDDDMIPHESMGMRRYAAAVDLPLDGRLRVRMGRALENAMRYPQRGTPTLRRMMLVVLPRLRAAGLSDPVILAKLGRAAEEIARARNIESTSIISQRARWEQLHDRIVEWMAIDAAQRAHDTL